MIRRDPRGAAVGTVLGPSGRSVPALVAALALLVAVLAGLTGATGRAGGAAETAAMTSTSTPVVTAAGSAADPSPGPVAVPPAPAHALHAATWLWWIPADQILVSVLLAAMLLAVARPRRAAARSPQAPPLSRAPPHLALPS